MLKKVMLVFAILGLLVATPVAEAVDSQPRNIILFGWDGAQRNHVNECLSRKELPTLQKLSKEGAYIEIDIEGVTDTKAGWSQILTGYYPEVTGVYSNGQYQSIPKGLSIGERLEKHFGPDNIVTLAVIGKKGHVDADPPKKIKVEEEAEQPKAKKPRARKKQAAEAKAAKQKAAKKKAAKPKKKPQGKIIEEDGVKYRLVPGKPHYNMSTNTDLFENGLTLDQKVGTRAIELIETHKDKPFFFFVHFAEVDSKGHKQGENSKEYNDALISNDTWTGKIMDKIKELGLADKTQYYITTDHGFNEDGTGHSFAPYVFLATNNKKVNRNGRRQDVAPTILEAFGLDLNKIEPPLDGISLTKPDKRPPAKIGPAKKAAKAAGKQKAAEKRAARKRNRQKSQP
ncbi:MAG TPA: alkaline phosphatase family protein [Sedimentisphaerales bacterium]|nr:alkaline phosphatase family protein [Sedimentisphaerales bacterium]